MAVKWLSDQVLKIIANQGVALPGLTGSPDFPRATEVRGLLKIYHFNIEADAVNPFPGSSAGALASTDSIVVALLRPTDRIYFGQAFANAWGGTTVVGALGKVDPNGSGGTDLTHYCSGLDLSAGFANQNLIVTNSGEQVGVDPAGDQSVGNKIPSFGSANIQIVFTVAGTLNVDPTGLTLNGWIAIVEEGN